MIANPKTLRSAPSFLISAPEILIREGRYVLRFAQNVLDLDRVLKLRFEVFNLELGEGLQSSFLSGRDCDEFDAHCHHLLIEEEESGNVVGTYRLQTSEMAAAGNGFYSAGEFDFSHLPADVVLNAIELGRACIAPAHRHTNALFLLWKGIAAYSIQQQKRYLFGCCSLASQNPNEGLGLMQQLKNGGYLHPEFFIAPNAGYECEPEGCDNSKLFTVRIPKLFKTYLRFGAIACGVPAIDREFKTIDYFVIFDLANLNEVARRLIFEM